MFEEEDYRLLDVLAAETASSVGELVRAAVKQVYVESKDQEQAKRDKAFEALKKLQAKTRQSGRVDYKALIEYGRKY